MPSDTNSGDRGARKTDAERVVESLVVMAFAVFLYGVTYTFDEVPPILAQGVEPTVFPRAILIFIFLLAALQVVRGLRLSPEKIARLKPCTPVPRIVYLTAAVLVAFALLLPVIGTFPALALFCPGLAFLWGERRWRLMALSFAGFIAFIYVLFVVLLNIPLP